MNDNELWALTSVLGSRLKKMKGGVSIIGGSTGYRNDRMSFNAVLGKECVSFKYLNGDTVIIEMRGRTEDKKWSRGGLRRLNTALEFIVECVQEIVDSGEISFADQLKKQLL